MSVHKEGGTYKVRYRIGSKQHSKSGFKTKREAQAYEAQQLRKIRNSTWVDPNVSKTTVKDVYQSWIAASSRSERTNYDYQQLWSKHVEPAWGHYPVGGLSPTDIMTWINKLQKDLKPSTVKKIVSVLTQILDWAVADRMIDENPIKRAKNLSVTPLVKTQRVRKDKRLLTHREVEILANTVPANYKDFVNFLAYTGLRFGEATALQVGDLDLLNGRVLVRRAFSNVAGNLLERPTKNSSERIVSIPNFLLPSLNFRVSQATTTDELVFTTTSGTIIRNERFRRDILRPALEKLNIQNFRIHDFRHTCAALSVQAGINPKTLQKALGHSDIRLTMDIYGGLFEDDLDVMSNKLEQARNQARKDYA